jgi:hypothetical protein
MELKEIGCENGAMIELSPDHDELQALVPGVLLAQCYFYSLTERIMVKLTSVMAMICDMSRKEAVSILKSCGGAITRQKIQ